VIETFTLSFGGVSSRTDKKIWIKSSIAQSSALIATMSDANMFAPEPYTPSAFDVSDILDLQRRLEAFRAYLQSIDELTLDPRPSTMHADYLQFIVDRMTEVFLKFKPISDIKRSSDPERVYGAFPDFIRAAAKPYLMKSYPRYRAHPARYEKLDRQIQRAQKDAASRARRYEQNAPTK
jgi:hypothetical protein